MPNRMEENTFSTPPNIGEPAPAGTPVTAHSTTPPTLSQSSLARSISARMSSSARARMTAKEERLSRAIKSPGMSKAGKESSVTEAILAMWAAIFMPRRSKTWRQTAPANTRGAVRRPEKWPPPRMSLAP